MKMNTIAVWSLSALNRLVASLHAPTSYGLLLVLVSFTTLPARAPLRPKDLPPTIPSFKDIAEVNTQDVATVSAASNIATVRNVCRTLRIAADIITLMHDAEDKKHKRTAVKSITSTVAEILEEVFIPE